MKKVTKKLIPYEGTEWTLSALAKKLGLSRQALWMRIQRMPLADALRDKPGRQAAYQRENCTWILIDGKAFTCERAAEHFDVSTGTIRRWVREKRLELYKNKAERRCSSCGDTTHRLSSCPEVHLKRGKRRLPGSPPPEKELRAAGILPRVPRAVAKLEL